MLDIKRIKDDPEAVKAGLRAKEVDCDAAVDRILELDAQRRALILSTETDKAEQNRVSKEIPKRKKAGEDVAPIFARMAELKAQIAQNDQKLTDVEAEYRTLMLSLPNLPDPDLKPGGKENNEPLRYYGEPHHFDFEPKHHVDLCTDLGLIDYERGTRLAGSGFWIYRGMGARLEWALLNYFIDEHLKDGYEMVGLPLMLEYQCGETAGQFPKFADEVYKIENPTDDRMHFMLPTAETALASLHRGEILAESCSPTRRASAARQAPTAPTSAAWSAGTSSTRSRCSSTPCPRSPTRPSRSWSARLSAWSRGWASTSAPLSSPQATARPPWRGRMTLKFRSRP